MSLHFNFGMPATPWPW